MTSVRIALAVALITVAPCVAFSAGASAEADTVRTSPLDDGVTALYFHRTIRCETCLRAEALADSLLTTAFADETAAGRLAWVVVNVEEPGNEGFVDRYELGPFGLVLSIRSCGEETFCRELESIEDLAAYPGLFDEYLSDEVRHALARYTGELSGARDTKKEDHLEDARGVLP